VKDHLSRSKSAGVRLHPEIETLVRYRDGDMAADRQAEVEGHLAACDKCRSNLRLVRKVFGQVEPEPAAAEIVPALPAVLAKIQQWEASQAGPAGNADAVKDRVAHQVGLFLGNQATRRVFEQVSDDNSNLLTIAGSVLCEFLGREPAAVLVSSVVDKAIVRF
jgi:putative zinc finger protein